MQYKFEVLIETDEAEAGELEEAIEDALLVLDMPNGDTLYLVHAQVIYVPNVEISGTL